MKEIKDILTKRTRDTERILGRDTESRLETEMETQTEHWGREERYIQRERGRENEGRRERERGRIRRMKLFLRKLANFTFYTFLLN